MGCSLVMKDVITIGCNNKDPQFRLEDTSTEILNSFNRLVTSSRVSIVYLVSRAENPTSRKIYALVTFYFTSR